MLLGIDLGTTNSVAAYMAEDGPRLIPNALGETLTPSVVAIDENGEFLVGRAAREMQISSPERCASLFKRHMGSDFKAKICGREFSAEMLSGIVLRSIKEDATAFLGQEISGAVITVPAYFNDNQRKATLRAGQFAGLDVRRIVNEPTAAALAYGLQDSQQDRLLLVFDLGGGTFDVSLVEVFDRALEVRASSGESFLGGEDFSAALAARLLHDRNIVFESAEVRTPKLVSRLLQQCETAKCVLSKEMTTRLRIPDEQGFFREDDPAVDLSRAQFQAWTEHILARVEMPIRRALGDAGVKPVEIDEIILVGGATRMPSVLDFVTRFFGKLPRCSINPDEVVALGAAVQAGLVAGDQQLEDLVVTDVSPFTMGIEISKQIGEENRDGYYMPIINRNTTIPTSRVKRVVTLAANQTVINVKVYQGESRRVDGNLKLGEFAVEGIPRGPAGQEVDVRFTYDLNGILEVEATVIKTQRKVQHLIAKDAKGMSASQISEAVELMQSLKMHPREEAVNRWLMGRAERVFNELPLNERNQLSDLLDGFETAMELAEKVTIGEFREAIQRFLDQFDPGGANDDENFDSGNGPDGQL